MRHNEKHHMIEQFKIKMSRQDDPRVFFAPGRVNLIGEHIDYNGGLVFPAAISLGTYGLIGLRDDQKVRLYSDNFKNEDIITLNFKDLSFDATHGWANYVKGILNELILRGHVIDQGFDLWVSGNLPTASGLSSSASLELLIAYMLKTLFQLSLTRTELATLSRDVENDYMGMHCGIMDQLIIARGVKHKALLMNTATLEVEALDASFKGYQFIIMNTNYQRKTTESKYNERVSECSEALKAINIIKKTKYLCDLKRNDLPMVRALITDDVIYKRARHVITEQARTIEAREAMLANEPVIFAGLLNQSHQSLKEDYDVTGLHLDTLVNAALEHGALGARVTGAGFGGCAIALVPQDAVSSMKSNVGRIYKQVTGLDADFYEVSFEDGVSEVIGWN